MVQFCVWHIEPLCVSCVGVQIFFGNRNIFERLEIIFGKQLILFIWKRFNWFICLGVCVLTVFVTLHKCRNIHLKQFQPRRVLDLTFKFRNRYNIRHNIRALHFFIYKLRHPQFFYDCFYYSILYFNGFQNIFYNDTKFFFGLETLFFFSKKNFID